jgi:hypothetical protein
MSREMESFCRLYTTVLTAPADREIMEQRYLSNPFGDLLMYVAIDEGRIVANYSAVPVEVTVDGETRRSALSLNTMTHSSWAGKGVFPKLAAALYDDIRARDYAMIIGFPNYLSNRIFNTRLEWKTVYEIPTLKLALDGTETKTAEPVAFRDCFAGLKDNSGVSRVHIRLSPQYLAWRFRDSKEKRYHVLAVDEQNWLICQFYRKEINITELCCTDPEARNCLVDQAIAAGRQAGMEAVTVWAMANTELHSKLERKGFRLSSPIRTFGLRCFDSALSGIVGDWRNWFVQMGDDNTY